MPEERPLLVYCKRKRFRMTSLCVPFAQLLKHPLLPTPPTQLTELSGTTLRGRAVLYWEPCLPCTPAEPLLAGPTSPEGRISAIPDTAAGFRLGKPSRVLK